MKKFLMVALFVTAIVSTSLLSYNNQARFALVFFLLAFGIAMGLLLAEVFRKTERQDPPVRSATPGAPSEWVPLVPAAIRLIQVIADRRNSRGPQDRFELLIGQRGQDYVDVLGSQIAHIYKEVPESESRRARIMRVLAREFSPTEKRIYLLRTNKIPDKFIATSLNISLWEVDRVFSNVTDVLSGALRLANGILREEANDAHRSAEVTELLLQVCRSEE
jgi:hypothetical protein